RRHTRFSRDWSSDVCSSDLAATQRLAGARTPEEKEAVEIVLGEFFELQEDGWHNRRADEEIEEYQSKQEGKKAEKEAEAERKRQIGRASCRERESESRTAGA